MKHTATKPKIANLAAHGAPRLIQNRRGVDFILAASAAIFASIYVAAPARAGWSQTTTGTYDYNTGANWSGGIINGVFDQTSLGNQVVTIAATTTVSGPQFVYKGGFDMTLQAPVGGSSSRVLALSGGITVDTDADGRTVTIGSSGTNEGVRIALGGAIQDFTVAGGDFLIVTNSITNATNVGIGDGGINKKGSGTLRLAGTSTYTLGTTLTDGTLAVALSSALGTGAVTLNGGRIYPAGGSRNLANNFIIGGDTAIGLSTASANTMTISGTTNLGATLRTVTIDGPVTFSGAISGTGGVVLTTGSATARTITFGAANDFTGGLTIGGSATVALGAAGAIADANSVNLSSATAGLNISAISATSETIGSLAGVASSTVTLGDKNLTIGADNTSTSFAGLITGNTNTGSVTKIGDGALTLSTANTYSGGTTLSAGTLALGSNTALGSGTVTMQGGRLASSVNNRTLVNNFVISGDVTFGGSGYVATILNGATDSGTALRTITLENTHTFGGSISGSGGIAFTTGAVARTVNLNAPNDFTGGLAIGGSATVALGALGTIADTNPVTLSSATAILNISGISSASETIGSLAGVSSSSVVLGSKNLTLGANDAAATFAGIISGTAGAASVTKIGAGVQTFSGANTYVGTTSIQAGTLRITGAGTLGLASSTTTPGSVVINSGATLFVDQVTNSSFNATRGFAIGPTSGTGSATVQVADDPANDIDATINGIITDNGGSGRLIKTGGGKLRLFTSVNSFTGGLSILEGTLVFANDSRLGAIPASATPGSILINGGTLQLQTLDETLSTNRGVAIGPASGNGSGTISVDPNLTLTYGGVVANNSAGSGGLIKTGAGRLNLGGASTYTGPTQVTAGTLAISGSINASTSVNVTGGTLLLGASNVIKNDASVTLASGTLQTGGNSEFTTTAPGLGALIIENTSTIDFGTGSSTLWFSGLTSIAGTLNINNWSGSSAGGGVDQLRFTNDPSPLVGQINFTGLGGATGIFFSNGGNSYYEIVPVPEPSSTALIGATALLALIGFRERRRLLVASKRASV